MEVTAAENDLRRLVADLRAFEQRKEIQKFLRTELRKPLPEARQAIRQKAVATLPGRNGLGQWVARTRINLAVRASVARTAGITLKGGRNSSRQRSDINAIDRGRVRAPSWGRRGPGAWHNQSVNAGFFTETVTQDLAPMWREATVRAVDDATRMLRNG